MEGESGRTRGWGGTCRRDAVSSVRSSKLNQKKIHIERDGAMVIGGHNKSVDTTTNQIRCQPWEGHGEGARLRKNKWGGAFCNCLMAANEAKKNKN